MPYVSIIIPVYYSVDRIEASSYSLQEQSFIIVVDSTSDGATASMRETMYLNIRPVRSSLRLLPNCGNGKE